jgi:hypothetical protein
MYVKALTSASQLVKEISFSKLDFENKKIANKIRAQYKKTQETLSGLGEMSEQQKKKFEEEQKKKEVVLDKAK